MKGEVCANCGHKIGRLEQAYLYKDIVVCELCYNRLKLTEETAVPFEEVRSPQQKLSDVEKPPIKGKWNGFCITAFVLSLVNLPGPEIEMSPDVRAIVYGLSFIVFVLSIVFAGIGLSQIEKNAGMRGRGLGIAALIISIGSFILIFLF